MNYFLGVDIGSVTTKVALLLSKDGEDKVISYKITATGPNGENTSLKLIDEILKEANLKMEDIKRIVATGYGRVRVNFTKDTKTEISCHAKGVKFYFPQARTVIDIGGQDSKVIKIGKNNLVVDFVMNDKCAAGTGRFLEIMSNVLHEDLKNFGEIHANTKNHLEITNICTVFAESEVITLLSEGKDKNEIIKGLNYSVAKRVLNLAKRIGIEKDIVMTGGVAKNGGVVLALEELLGEEIKVPSEPQIVGALGAALFAKETE